MLLSEKIKKIITSEIKSQETLLKLLDNQEKNYHEDYSNKKEAINKSLAYYNKVLEEGDK